VRDLLAARVRAGLTQEQVARKPGTKKSAISRLESGTVHRPTLTTIGNYGLVVGCRVEILLRPWRNLHSRF
jgi:transcriptional regulator with XRE-family HTH domain